MMNQKPLSAQLEDRRTHSMELDPSVVARSFGVVLPVNQPLPESPFPIGHAENDAASEILLDELAPRTEPAEPILDIAMRRLNSLPKSPKHKEEIENAISVFAAPLEALDLLIAKVETEHFDAISNRWEQVRQRGRELADAIIPKLEKEKYRWEQAAQKSGEAKAQRAADALQCLFERQKISEWASASEIAAADKRKANAGHEAAAAAALALEDMRELAVAESKLESAKGTLQLLKKELQRCAAELRGDVYHDPETGLARSPLAHREKW